MLWLPVVAWAALIFAFSATPNLRFSPDNAVDFVVRKSGHMFVFGVLAVLLWRAIDRVGPRARFAGSWALAASYAATDEFHQSFTAGRHPSAEDVGIDATGALIGLIVLAVGLRLIGRRRSVR